MVRPVELIATCCPLTSDQNEMAEPLNTDRDWSWLVVQPLWTKLIQIQRNTKVER